MGAIVTREGLGLRQVWPRTVCSVWVLDFMQGRFHNTSPGDLKSAFIKAGDSETKEGLRVEKARS